MIIWSNISPYQVLIQQSTCYTAGVRSRDGHCHTLQNCLKGILLCIEYILVKCLRLNSEPPGHNWGQLGSGSLNLQSCCLWFDKQAVKLLFPIVLVYHVYIIWSEHAREAWNISTIFLTDDFLVYLKTLSEILFWKTSVYCKLCS